jgi:hypothetical protein
MVSGGAWTEFEYNGCGTNTWNRRKPSNEMSDQEAPSCWICGGIADSAEHVFKAKDLRRIFDQDGYEFEKLPFHFSERGGARLPGPKSARVKYPPLICRCCNNERPSAGWADDQPKCALSSSLVNQIQNQLQTVVNLSGGLSAACAPRCYRQKSLNRSGQFGVRDRVLNVAAPSSGSVMKAPPMMVQGGGPGRREAAGRHFRSTGGNPLGGKGVGISVQ